MQQQIDYKLSLDFHITLNTTNCPEFSPLSLYFHLIILHNQQLSQHQPKICSLKTSRLPISKPKTLFDSAEWISDWENFLIHEQFPASC